ncbi:hypothetical protein [Vagococcus sp.]|uniref:hypothetical protein n=1 Tax=Vagococcus sp. TaxID=1933889 RepID=UPI003F9949F6
MKIKLVMIGLFSLFLFSACTANHKLGNERQIDKKTLKSQSSEKSGEYDEEVQKALDEANKEVARAEIEKKARKEKRIASGEPVIELEGKVTDVLTKPDSGLDLYRITLKITSIKQDKNNLYHDKVGIDYQYFLSAHDYPDFAFDKLNKGDSLKIETFQDAYMTESPPKQISEEDITRVSLLKD